MTGLLRDAHRTLLRNYGRIFTPTALFLLPGWMSTLLLQHAAGSPAVLLTLFLLPAILMAPCWAAATLAPAGNPWTAFQPRNWLHTATACLLLQIPALLATIALLSVWHAAGQTQPHETGTALWKSAVVLCGSAILATRFAFAIPHQAKTGKNALQSLSASWAMTKGAAGWRTAALLGILCMGNAAAGLLILPAIFYGIPLWATALHLLHNDLQTHTFGDSHAS